MRYLIGVHLAELRTPLLVVFVHLLLRGVVVRLLHLVLFLVVIVHLLLVVIVIVVHLLFLVAILPNSCLLYTSPSPRD